jgi:hypothetical protein
VEPGGLRRRVLVAAATAVVAAVAAVVALGPLSASDSGRLTPGVPQGSGHPVAARIVLARLARVAAAQPPAPAPHGSQYRLTSEESVNPIFSGDRCTLLSPSSRQTWVNDRGGGLISENAGKLRLAVPEEARICAKYLAKYNALVGSGVSESRFADHCLSVNPTNFDPKRIPTNPTRLRRALERDKIDGVEIDGAANTPAAAFERATDLLRNTYASPRSRAALYRAAAGLPGVRSLGTVRDHAGRAAQGDLVPTQRYHCVMISRVR